MRSFIVRYRHVTDDSVPTSPTYLGVVYIKTGLTLTAGRDHQHNNQDLTNRIIRKVEDMFEEQVEQDEIEPEASAVEVTGIGNWVDSTPEKCMGHALMPIHPKRTVVRHYEPSGRWE